MARTNASSINLPRIHRVFTNADGTYSWNVQPAQRYFATIPGNYAMNLRRMYLLNTNYAD